jgi:beta-ureidopropionase / N-carbamoyl-L-amino-acid hydrolase
MHLDLRSPDDAILAEADAILHSQFAEIEIKANGQIERSVSFTRGRATLPARRGCAGTRSQ